tara:strand:+ start:1474 stop:1713 length:240 start_codon:yes stop_codon:yes gene_type:complete
MNTIFDRIIEIEDKLNNLIEDLNMEVEYCPNNKEEIEHELISASRAVSRVYTLNKENFSDNNYHQEDLKNFVDKGGKII